MDIESKIYTRTTSCSVSSYHTDQFQLKVTVQSKGRKAQKAYVCGYKTADYAEADAEAFRDHIELNGVASASTFARNTDSFKRGSEICPEVDEVPLLKRQKSQ